MQLTRKKTCLLALAIAAVFIAGFALAAVVLPPRYIYITVEEAISVSPESITIKMYPGETETAEFTITNKASVEIPLKVSAKVTAIPEGGSAEDITLVYPETLLAKLGNTPLTIEITVATGAVPGDYTITVTVTRV